MAPVIDSTKPRSFNPFVCDATVLSPNMLFAAKALVFYMLVTGKFFSNVGDLFLPFIPAFDSIPDPEIYKIVLQAVFVICSMLLLMNRAVRFSSTLLGFLIIASIFSAQLNYSSSMFFYGCILIFIGLQDPKKEPWLLRFQVVIVYLGAGVNKLFDLHWQSGQFFEFWTHHILEHQTFMSLAAMFAPMVLSQIMCWLVIGVELLLAVGFLIPKTYKPALVLGVCFHLGMLIFTGGLVSVVFTFGVFLAYLAFIPTPPAHLLQKKIYLYSVITLMFIVMQKLL